MKTPYDAALRVAARELDAARAAIADAAAALDRAELAHESASAALRRESEAAGDPHLFSTHHYFVRARSERDRLMAERDAAAAEVERRRDLAAERLGGERALSDAAQRYRIEIERAADAADQSALDDRSAARLVRARRRAALLAPPAAS